jgi:uncharacterized protein (TIGR02611 family)
MSGEDAPEPKPSLVDRLRDQREHHASRPLWQRALFVMVGFTLFLGGIAMLVLPGPAFAVIPIGLAILSLVFAWAARWLELAIDKAEKAKQSAKETSRMQRIVIVIAVTLACVAAIAASFAWEIPIVPYT